MSYVIKSVLFFVIMTVVGNANAAVAANYEDVPPKLYFPLDRKPNSSCNKTAVVKGECVLLQATLDKRFITYQYKSEHCERSYGYMDTKTQTAYDFMPVGDSCTVKRVAVRLIEVGDLQYIIFRATNDDYYTHDLSKPDSRV